MSSDAEVTSGAGRRRATLRDVAARAGVSVATASRTLSGDYPIGSGTRDKVTAAIAELGYTHTPRARPTKSARAVAIVTNSVATPLLSGIAGGVEQAASAAGRLCLIGTTHGDEGRERATIELMVAQEYVDAVIMVGGAYRTRDYEARMAQYARQLWDAGSRLVLCGRPALTSDAPALVVDYDNEGGAHAITSYLLSRGHRRIAYLGGDPGYSTHDDRFAGFVRAMSDHGVVRTSLAVSTGPVSIDSAYVRTLQLVDTTQDLTAIVVYSDYLAAPVVRALRARGLRVPEDVSVVGYDNIGFAYELQPALTTVHLPHAELGKMAVDLALEKPLPGSGSDRVMIGTHVVVRDSVASVRVPSL